ncbi:hypothetical protein ACLIBG_12170 [Virgibacillus sp. W0181]|uniref:hypothetical protein n=1 Tax=Virgibacillus sp. W0181 TaxID=3391581 RepID=UPI003F45FE13
MSRTTSLIQSYLFLKRNRFSKKRKMYKMAFHVMIDWTIAIYLFVMVAYCIAAIFIFSDTMDRFSVYFHQMESFASERLSIFLTVLPAVYVLRSFKDPGIRFTSSEYQLSILTYSRKSIWLLCAVEKLVKKVFLFIFVGLVVVLLTPIHPPLVITYILLLIFVDVMMTAPQWKLFQQHFFVKLLFLIGILFVNTFQVFIPSIAMAITATVTFLAMNIILSRRLLNHVLWERVMEVNDFQTWNMTVVSQATGLKYKRQKKYSMIQKIAYPKRPFIYKEASIHHRLWQLYFGKNLDLVFRITGAMLLLLVVLLFLQDFIYYIAIAVVIHIYTTAAASFYKDRFASDLIEVLPWNLDSYKKSFFKWVVYGFLILLVPITIFVVMHASIWAPLQLLLYVGAFLYEYHVKLDKSKLILSKQRGSLQMQEAMGLFILFIICFSGTYPILSLFSVFVIYLLIARYKKSHPSESVV